MMTVDSGGGTAVADSGPVAIVGMSCLLPGALGLEAYWRNLLQGADAFREVPESRWPWRRYYSPDRTRTDATSCKVAAFLEGFEFSWRKYRMPPKLVAQLNPMHLALMEATGQALEDAGFPRRPQERERTGYVLGSLGLGITADYGLRVRADDYLEGLAQVPELQRLPEGVRKALLEKGRAAIDGHLKPIAEDNMLGAIASIPLGRCTSAFGLLGPHFVVDAGYGSSLAAVDAGIRCLADGTCDQVLVAGISPYLFPLEFIAFSRTGALSERHVLPFDERADGTLFGEGACVVVLKRLEDAVRDGHRVYALISGVGTASNGAGPALFAPNAAAVELALRRALADARFEPEDIQFVECHATGTPLGDEVEVSAVRGVLGTRVDRPRVALGSVKELVGHLQSGAGMASLVKTALALHHGVIPPQHRLERPRPELKLEGGPFEVLRRPAPWSERAAGRPHRACLDSIGFGGVNYAACLESWRPERAARARAWARPASRPEPIAIIGMGGVFPGASSVEAFWKNNVAGVDAIREVPRERFEVERYYDASGARRERSYTKLGAFIEPVSLPPTVLKMPPRSVASLDPTQVLVLKACLEALGPPGARRWDADNVAVIISDMPQREREMQAALRVSAPEYRRALEGVFAELGVAATERDAILDGAEEAFKRGFPPLTEDSLVGYLGGIITGRVSRHYGFRGPNFVVESACASSLHALATAIRGLRQGRFSMAVCGGVCTNISPEIFTMVCSFNGLSRRGISPFDARADGFLVGEGAGVVVLKRLSDARRDGDQVLATVLSVGGSSDGEGRSVFAPNPVGQALAIRRGLEEARLSPADVDYIECHGTGTAVGDVSEVQAYTSVYGRHGRSRPIALSSVKSMIGHLNAAAGVAGLIRVVCALGAKQLPPTLHFEKPNPEIDFSAGPFDVVTRAAPWHAEPGKPRRAAVSSFGLGGSNAHAIIEGVGT